MDKDYLITQYQKLKELNNGKKPLYKDFLKYCNTQSRKVELVFGKDAYSKLQQECGDNPNKLQMERTSNTQILDQYGQLVRKNQKLPVTAEWIQAKFKPTPEGLNKIHNLKWGDMPSAFLKEYSNKPEWKDVVEIINQQAVSSSSNTSDKIFDAIVEKIVAWTPDRKRIIEEGYKAELRYYLEKYFNVEEEVGESNADLLINKKYPLEVKKDPSLSEYDRLLGQMIRHNKAYKSAIAIVTNVSTEDRFKKFHKLFTEVHDRLGLRAELIKK